MDFGSYLENVIRKKGISINSLSKECGINRGVLYRIFKNQLRLKEEKLFEIIRTVGLNAAEEEKLVRLFFGDAFGEAEFSRVETMLAEIQRIGREDSAPPEFAPFQRKTVLLGEGEICSALARIIDGNDVVTTNFSYFSEAIDRLFYSAVREGRLRELRHIITLAEDGGYAHHYRSLSASFKYMYLQCFPYYRWRVSAEPVDQIAFRYFAVGADCAVLFNADWGIFIEDSDALAKLNAGAADILAQCQRLGTVIENELDIKQIYQDSYADKERVVSFQGYLCVAPFVDYEFIRSIIREEIPQPELLAKIAFEHYKNLFNSVEFLQFATVDGLKRFAGTGNVGEISGALIKPAEAPYRIRILERIARAAEEGSFYLLDDQKFYMPRDLAIEKYEKRIIIGGFDRNVPNFGVSDKFLAELSDVSMINTMERAAEYLIRSRQVHRREFTQLLIDELLLQLRDQIS